MSVNERLYLSSPHMSEEGYELDYINEAFRTNWIAPLGENVNRFESEVAEKIGVRAAAALSSGTAAIHMALKAAGIGPGDIVLCQSLTFAATANPIVYLGATPVFIDSCEKTWNMDPDALETAIKTYRPKAVIVVHLYGLSADMDAVGGLCRKHGVILIEDAAESLGTLYKNGYSGTFGDYGIYSFNGNKIITTSGGGMLVSDSTERVAKVKFWATQSREPARHYQHSEIGYNYRMSNVLAGIGRGQLKVLDQRVARKREIYAFYKKALSGVGDIGFMPDNAWDRSNRWLSCILLRGAVRPGDVIDALEAENIESRPVWKPMHLQPVFKGCDYVGGGVSEKLFADGLCLPSDTKMTEEEQLRTVEIIKALFG